MRIKYIIIGMLVLAGSLGSAQAGPHHNYGGHHNYGSTTHRLTLLERTVADIFRILQDDHHDNEHKLSPVVAEQIGEGVNVTIPPNRCAHAMRIDYSASYQLVSMGGVFLNLYVNGHVLDNTRFATWWGEPGDVFFESHQSSYQILTDMSQTYTIRMQRTTYDGTAVNVIRTPLMHITCIGESGTPDSDVTIN